jgi:hypothetical protein
MTERAASLVGHRARCANNNSVVDGQVKYAPVKSLWFIAMACVAGAAVQDRNIHLTSLMTMDECWHNNHHAVRQRIACAVVRYRHAFPFDARLRWGRPLSN